MQPAERARTAIEASGIQFTTTVHGPVHSLEEAAAARGLAPEQVVKSIVVRRGSDDHLFVLVPGGRSINWPKLRDVLGVNRASMPSAEEALIITGYERGTITPFGSLQHLPVIIDVAVPRGQVSIGGGAHGVAFTVDADDLVRVLDARVADIGQ